MNLPTIALSLRQPWAWLVLNAGKDIENRTWPTKFRGQFLIHAAKGMTMNEYVDAFDCLDEIETTGQLQIPTAKELQRGGIVGVARIADCVDKSKSPWFFGPYGFQLSGVRVLPFRPCKGMLGFFKCNYDELKEAA